MSEPILNTLTQRLDRLERENRRLKIAGAIVLLALAGVGAMGQMIPRAVPKVVEAERFVLRDTKGKPLATLGTEASGTSGLVLSDQNGKARAALGVLADGTPTLVFFDQNGKLRATVEGAGLSLRDESEKLRAGLGVEADGTSALRLSDQNGKARAALSLLPDGAPVLIFAGQKARAVLSVKADAPRLDLRDQNGKARAAMIVGADGAPLLFLADQNGKPLAALDGGTSGPSLILRDGNRDRAVLGHTALEATATGTVEQRPASSLVLFDRDGKVIWRAP